MRIFLFKVEKNKTYDIEASNIKIADVDYLGDFIECSSIEEMNALEKQLITQYKTIDKNYGYNCEQGGNNKIPSDLTRQKQSQSHIGLKMPDQHK